MDDIQLKWREVLEILRVDMLSSPFNTWILPLKPLGFDEETSTLTLLTTEYSLGYIKARYVYVVEKAAEQVFGQPVHLHFETDDNNSPMITDPKIHQAANGKVLEEEIRNEVNLNPRYTFKTFVVGKNNEIAHAACVAVANGPVSTSTNPLFIYGNSGLGKTHLMHAIGHQVLLNNPSKKVLYVSSEMFTNELIQSLQKKKMEEFRDKYRNVDYLMIDDIQFIEKKESTQEELFHTFNVLYDNNKQIIFTSDRPPKDISTIEQRLRSRFESGLPVDIHEPEFETRVAILQNKAEMEDIDVVSNPELQEILFMIATNITTNIRELEGALNRVIAHASFVDQPLTKEMARTVLEGTFNIHRRTVDIPLIKDTVCTYFGITIQEIDSAKRTKKLAHPRQIAMYLCREMTDESFPKIGTSFGNKDHSTVLHACNKISDELKKDKELNKVIEDLKARINDQ